MSWLLMEKLLRHQQSVRSSEGCCVDRLNSPVRSGHCADTVNVSLVTLNGSQRPAFAVTHNAPSADSVVVCNSRA